MRVAADADRPARAHDPVGGGLQKELGTVGVVDPVVERAATGVAGLLDAGLAAALVGHAGRPHLLGADRGEDRRGRVLDRSAERDRFLDRNERVGRTEESVDGEPPRSLDDRAVGIEEQSGRGHGHADDRAEGSFAAISP